MTLSQFEAKPHQDATTNRQVALAKRLGEFAKHRKK